MFNEQKTYMTPSIMYNEQAVWLLYMGSGLEKDKYHHQAKFLGRGGFFFERIKADTSK